MWYKLDENKNVVPAANQIKAYDILGNPDSRRVGYDVIGGLTVSTVFLGIDHGFGGTPLFFETIVFGPDGSAGDDFDMERCATWAEAEEMHRQMCDNVRRTMIKAVK